MVEEIRIYIEGGGDSKTTWKKLIKGFGQFFKNIRAEADEKDIGFKVIASGPRSEAYKDFKLALQSNPEAFNILLVDSEGPVPEKMGPWLYLKNRDKDKWAKPKGAKDENCHLMAQVMEAWLVADLEAMEKYYGQGFKENVFREAENVENISKETLLNALKSATKGTGKKKYHKTKHGFEMLGRLDVSKVRAVAPHCNRLFNTLEQKIGE